MQWRGEAGGDGGADAGGPSASSSSGGSCKSVRVSGTHCDGLFADRAQYVGAVRELLARKGFDLGELD